MKATLNWLREFAAIPEDADQVAAALESLGHEVESIEHLEPAFTGVVVARAEELMPHPDADRIQLVRITTGDDETTVVCGAWNFRSGDVVAYAPPGATLAGGLEVETRPIRGVDSPGMICSERELGLGEDHEGILVLHPATGLGHDLAGLMRVPDVVFDLSITTNRPDAMGVIGLARDLAAYFEAPLEVPAIDVPFGGDANSARVTIEDPDGCPRFTAREVRNITVAPSPIWLRQRLSAIDVRPINNVVDVSNYVMMERGHPTHTFDMDRLGNDVVIRRAAAGENLRTLDEVDRQLLETDMVVADADRAVAIAGVIGGQDTEVTDDTTRVLVEVAYFDPASVMLTSKRHAVRTEASARFERGMDPEAPPVANDRVSQLLAEVAGGVPAPDLVDAYPSRIEPLQLDLDPGQIERVLGFPLEPEVAAGYLTGLGFEVKGEEPFQVTVPTRRPDVTRPVELLEEIARLHGYDKVPETIARGLGGGIPAYEARYRKLRRVMVGAGFAENLSFSFFDHGDLDRLGLAPDDRRRDTVNVVNPVNEEARALRPTLLSGLLRAVASNFGQGLRDVSLFETGKVFLTGDGDLPEQPEMLAFVHAGQSNAKWFEGSSEAGAVDATGVWELIAEVMEVGAVELHQAAVAGFHPGRAVELSRNGAVFGALGELHPRTAAAFGIGGRVAAGEMNIEAMLERPRLWQFDAPSTFPPLVFDLAFEIDSEMAGVRLIDVVRANGKDLVESVTPFDVFEGPPLGEGRKSVAVRVTLRAPDRTLTDEEMAPIRAGMASAVERELGGTLRGEA